MNGNIEITFMRHGRSRADDENVIEGRYDAPLTDVGRKQSELRAEEFRAREIKFDLIIASPLKRAWKTARIVGRFLDVSVEADEDWMEKDNGPLAGMPHEVARAKYPLPAFHNPYQPHVVSADAGESTWALHCRAARALEQVIRKGRGRYLVVAHGGVLNATLGSIVGAQPPVSGQGIEFAFGDAGYIRTLYKPDQHLWVIREFVGGC